MTDATTTNKHPNEWVEYSNSLEDSLTEAKNYAAAITTKSDTDRDQLIAELKEQRKQTKMALEQIAKMTALWNKKENELVGQVERKFRREKRLCKNCVHMGYHEDPDCFKLEANK